VQRIVDNQIDLALVNLPFDKGPFRVTPLCPEPLVAILPAGTKNVPDEITPDYVAQPLLAEHTGSAGYAMVAAWLSKQITPREPMPIGTVEALKSAVRSKLGMAIVPALAVAKHRSEFVMRPLRPPLQRTLALIEHRNKPDNPALKIVRDALLSGLQQPTSPLSPDADPGRRRRPPARRRATRA
jgi:DNA-binding transcriptional LysR family regulator